MRFVFDSAKPTHLQPKSIDDNFFGYWSPVFHTHPSGYNLIIPFHPYGIDTTAGQFATLTLAIFPGKYDGPLRGPFPKVVHLIIRDQIDAHKTWTQMIQSTREPPFRGPTFSLKNDALFAVAIYENIPLYKYFSETDDYIVNDVC